MRKMLSGLLVVVWVLSVGMPAFAAWPDQFADVDTWPEWALKGTRVSADTFGAWGGDLAEAVWWELMVGDPPADGNPSTRRNFRPHDTITRAEYATILVRALGIQVESVTGAGWYRPAVDALKERGIITAEGDFGQAITRREIGDWVGRSLGWYGVDLTGKPELEFSDIAGLAEAEYIKLASRAGVIKGYPDGTYGPQRTATRTEAAAMAVRVAKQLTRNPPSIEVIEQVERSGWSVLTAIERELVDGGTYRHSTRLEPYMTPMALYGPSGLDGHLRFAYDFTRYDTYRNVVAVKVDPILLRDTIALVKLTLTIQEVRPDGFVEYTSSDTEYVYYTKRGDMWLTANTKEPTEYPAGWLPQPEVSE